MALQRTAKSCRSDAPMLASSLREEAQMTVSNKPGHRGEHEVSRKTIARGMPGDFRCDRGDYARVPFSFGPEAAGASCARHSLRPLISGARDSCTARANSRRGNAKACLMNAKAPHSHASSPGLTGRPSITETPENNREAAAYWIVRSRLRQGFDGACDLPGPPKL